MTAYPDVVRPRLLDLFCCEGGAGTGYARAGFEVVGVDINPQPLYPFKFIQADALEFVREWEDGRWPHLEWFDMIHASPPCQFATVYGNNKAHVKDDHPNLIPATRELLEATGLPYVIENVEGARRELRDPVRICGTGLGIRVRRHRRLSWLSAILRRLALLLRILRGVQVRFPNLPRRLRDEA